MSDAADELAARDLCGITSRYGLCMNGTQKEFGWLKAAIEKAGFFAVIEDDPAIDKDDPRVVCASHRREGAGHYGTSFWVTYRRGNWYLGSWRPEFYLLPAADRVVELCVSLLRRKKSVPLSKVPPNIIRRFALVTVEDIPDA